MPKIYIPTPLRSYTENQEAVVCTGATVGEALADLTARYAKLKRHLYDEGGRLRSFVNIYKNDEDVRYLEKEATRVLDSDTLSIVPSIAGGMAVSLFRHCLESPVPPCHSEAQGLGI